MMWIRTLLVTGCLLAFTGVSQAQEIGNGFTCSGTTILNKKGKVVKAGVAKNKIQKRIDALPRNKKTAAKRAALKAVKRSITSCSKGTFGGTDPDPTPSPSTDVAGSYSGTLTRVGPESDVSTCALAESISVSYGVSQTGTGVVVEPIANQFHSNLRGSTTSNGFEAKDISTTSAGKVVVTMTVTNVTDTSATFSVEKEALLRNRDRCSVTLNGQLNRTKN